MKAGVRIVLIIFLLLVLAAGGIIFYVWSGLQPVDASDEEVQFTIEQGMGTTSIASLLEEKGLIKNDLIFVGYLKWKEQGSRFQAGTYTVQPGASMDDIIAKLNSGDVVKEEMWRFTIPEGYTVKQIAERLNEFVDKETILDLSNSLTGLDLTDIESGSWGAQLDYKIEGYLFPDTYEVKKGSSETEILNVMIAEFKRKLNQIEDFEQKLEERGLTLHELLTLASLVEREVVVDAERPLVAGVIYNRLEKDMRLEIDATVQYALGETKERLLFSDLEIDSPYNTYKNAGLPPGPICSPSIASIQAALNPESSEYLFYVTKKDGTQEHLFGKTYKEHLANIEKSNSMSK